MLYDDSLPREEKEIRRSLTPDLAPLKKSWEWDAFEHDVKQVFIDLFEDRLRKQEREANVYGMPHLGSFELISRHVDRDGLALINNEDEPAMRYLFKAWKSRNPKRGLHFLRTYLQLLWPDSWELDQQWQDKNEPYPHALNSVRYIPAVSNDDASDTHYLTCRIVVAIEFDGDPFEMAKIEPGLRSSLGAEFLFELRVLVKAESSVKVSNASVIDQLVSLSGGVVFTLNDYQDNLEIGNHSSVNQIINLYGNAVFVFDTHSYDGMLAISNSSSIDQVVNLSGNTPVFVDLQSHDFLTSSVSENQIINLYGNAVFVFEDCSNNVSLSNAVSSSQLVYINDINSPENLFSSVKLVNSLSNSQIIKLNNSLKFLNKSNSKIELSNSASQTRLVTLKGKLSSGDNP